MKCLTPEQSIRKLTRELQAEMCSSLNNGMSINGRIAFLLRQLSDHAIVRGWVSAEEICRSHEHSS